MPFGAEQWRRVFEDFGEVFGTGFLHTLEFSLLGLVLALCIGIILGVFSVSQLKILRVIARVYVEFFQNTPLFLQLIFMYNVLPSVGIVLDVFPICVLGVGMYHGAYISEVVRTGIESVPKGQIEAAYSQGFNFFQTMVFIILPQCYKAIVPAMLSQVITVIKDTSFLAQVAIEEFFNNSKWIMSAQIDSTVNQSMRVFIIFGFVALVYFIINFTLSCIVRNSRKKQEA